MAYAERRERKKGVRYRGVYKAADGRYRSASTFSTEERALAVAEEAERHAAEVAGGAAGGLDPATRATRTIKEYAPLFLRHHQVEGNTKDTYSDTLTAYQVRHTHASWLIDAGENPKAVMHRLGQADLRTTARYVHVLGETGESPRSAPAGREWLSMMVDPLLAQPAVDRLVAAHELTIEGQSYRQRQETINQRKTWSPMTPGDHFLVAATRPSPWQATTCNAAYPGRICAQS